MFKHFHKTPNARAVRRAAAICKKRIRWVALPCRYHSRVCRPFLRDVTVMQKTMKRVVQMQQPQRQKTQAARLVSE